VRLETLSAERHRLIKTHALADARGFADDDAGSVIDEKAFVDFGAGMDVDSRLRMGDFADNPGQHRRAEQIELMGEAMPYDGGDARIAEDDLIKATRGGIAVK